MLSLILFQRDLTLFEGNLSTQNSHYCIPSMFICGVLHSETPSRGCLALAGATRPTPAMSSSLALSRFVCGRLSNPRPFIAVCRSSSPFKRTDSVDRRNFLKASATPTNFPFDSLRSKRGWPVLLPDLASKTFFTSRAMARSAGMDTQLIVVYITVPNKETATKLSSSLVSNKLAACVNQVPGVVSTYIWEGKVDEEILLIVKTRDSLLDALTVHVEANHPYTVPEVIALPILGGSDSYVKWVADNTLGDTQA